MAAVHGVLSIPFKTSKEGTVADYYGSTTSEGTAAGAGYFKLKRPLYVGAFSSATAGSGIAILRSLKTAAQRVYADDNGAVLWGTGSVPDLRVSLGRFLITADQTGGHVRLFGVQGQIAARNVAWNTEQAAGVLGLMELTRASGTMTFGGYGKSAAVCGTVAATGTITVNTNHILAGLLALSNVRAGLTQTGKYVGVLVDIYDATNWSDGTARVKFGYGMYIPARAANRGIQLGDSANTAGSAFAVNSTYTATSRCYSEDGGASLWGTGSVPDLRSSLSRFLITADQTGGHIRVFAKQGQIAARNVAWNTEQVAGVLGLMELTRDSGTMTFGGYGKTAAVCGTVAATGTITVNTNHILAGLLALSNVRSGLTQTGKYVGVLVDIYDATNWSDGTARVKFGYGIYIPARAADRGIQLGDSANSAGSAFPVNSSYTATFRCYSEDAGVALPASEVRGGQFRFLLTADSSARAGSVSALVGQMKLAANAKFPTDTCAGVKGYIECAGATTFASYIQTAVCGQVEAPSGADGGAGKVLSAFAANAITLAGISTGRASVIHVPNPLAGTWTAFADFGSASGCTQDTAAGANPGKFIKVYINGVLSTIATAIA